MIVRKNEAKTQEENAETTEIALYNSDLLPEVIENVDSIWNKPQFPYNTKPIKFSPKELKSALIEYAHNITPIDKLLISKHIKPKTFWHLVRAYDEISTFYLAAQRLKARKYGEAAQDLFETLPDDMAFYTIDRAGNKCLTSAGVRYLEVKATQMHRFAQIHETGSFIPLSKQETINKNLNLGVQLNGKLPDNFDLNSAGSDELINALKGKKKV